MRDDLLEYYESELSFLRQMGAEFAEKHPKIAARLQLEANRCDDPHVERLLEGFAFLAARVHLKIDDEFPQITEGLLSVLYPHFLRPIPSMTVTEFHLDPEQGKLTTGLKIPRGSVLYSRPVEGVPCKFRTCYDVTLWPFEVADAKWLTPDKLNPPLRAPEAVAALRLELRCLSDVSFDKLQLPSLRFFLNGEGDIVHTLYELLCNNCTQIVLRDPGNSRKPPVTLPVNSLRPMGFSEEESMLPYPRRSFVGYRLLQEYFSLPEKFFFFELQGLDATRESGHGRTRRDHISHCTFRGQPPAAKIGSWCQCQNDPSGMLAGHQFVSSNGGTDPVDPKPLGVPYRAGCAAQECHGDFFGR